MYWYFKIGEKITGCWLEFFVYCGALESGIQCSTTQMQPTLCNIQLLKMILKYVKLSMLI